MEKMICPSCKRKLRNINAWHYCKEVAIDDVFLNKSDEIVLAFDAILEKIAQWEQVEISATKNCIVFVRNKTFLVIKPLTKCLEVKFYSQDVIEDDDLYKCELWNSKFACIIRIERESGLQTKFFQYFKNSYQIS